MWYTSAGAIKGYTNLKDPTPNPGYGVTFNSMCYGNGIQSYLWNGNVSQVPCISRVTLIPSCLKPYPQYEQCVLAWLWKDLGSSLGSARISSYALLYLAMYSASTLCAARLTRMGNGWSSNEKSLMGRVGNGGQQCGWTLWGGTTAFCLHVYMSGPILGAPNTPWLKPKNNTMHTVGIIITCSPGREDPIFPQNYPSTTTKPSSRRTQGFTQNINMCIPTQMFPQASLLYTPPRL